MGSEPIHSQPDESKSSRVEMALPATTKAPGLARTFVRDRWPALETEILDDITLIVSELVSNAVQHGKPDIVLRMQVVPLAVDVSVLDHGPGVPPGRVVVADTAAISGRGLSIVERLASDWGVDELGGEFVGKSVWARLNVEEPTGTDS